VAEATGFADQSHFTKVFRRLVGVTPLQFRA
jgi:AraC family transcriptional regulator